MSPRNKLITIFLSICAVLNAAKTRATVPRATQPANTDASYTLFESGQVRPLVLSADAKLLFAANTPAHRLEIFSIAGPGAETVSLVASVPVGLEPVAVALRSPDEVWVVNHLSDSVS